MENSVKKIYDLLKKIESEIDDICIFNRANAISYIQSFTESAYNLETKEIYPSNMADKLMFAETRKNWISILFNIQLKLRKIMFKFNSEKALSIEEIAAFRIANLYLSYAQDFVLMKWSMSQDLHTDAQMFSSDFPITVKNTEFDNFQLTAGDIILVRGSTFISATIARTGDFPSNFSHVALVIESPAGEISVAESLMEEGLIVYSLEKYLSLEKLSRSLVLRPLNPTDGKAAAQVGFKIVQEDFNSPSRKEFDMLMDPNRRDKTWCFGFLIQAYDEATQGRIHMPTFPMSFKKALRGNSFFKGLGNKLEVAAAPDDAFFQPEFNVIMVHRDLSQIKKDWAFDVAVSAIFDFIFEKYEYKKKWTAALIAYSSYFIKNRFRINLKMVPPGVSPNVIQLILEHKFATIKLRNLLLDQMKSTPQPKAYKELDQMAKSYLDKNKNKLFAQLGKRDQIGYF
jgi:hypothetical protein